VIQPVLPKTRLQFTTSPCAPLRICGRPRAGLVLQQLCAVDLGIACGSRISRGMSARTWSNAGISLNSESCR
jgi:hypothetical protein